MHDSLPAVNLASSTFVSCNRHEISRYASVFCALTLVEMLSAWLQQSAGPALTLGVVLVNYGCHRLGKVTHGRPTWIAPLCAAVSYVILRMSGSSMGMIGFGLFILTFSHWLAHFRRWKTFSFASVGVLAAATCLVHPPSFMFIVTACLTVCVSEIQRVGSIVRPHVTAPLPLIPAALGLAAFWVLGASDSSALSAADKGFALSTLFHTGSVGLDVAVATLILAGISVLAWRVEETRIHWPLVIAAGILLSLTVLCPRSLLLSSRSADLCFLPPAAALLLLSLQVKISKPHGIAALVLLLSAALIRMNSVGAV